MLTCGYEKVIILDRKLYGGKIMNIKEKIEEVAKKLMSDKDLKEKFEKNPVAVLEELIGVDLPDDQINQIVDGIKAKIAVDSIGGMLGGLFGKKK